VRTSKLESRINELIPLEQKITCRGRKDTVNQEIQHQWQQNQNEISAEEFAQNLNFLCNLQNPNQTRTGYTDRGRADDNHQDLTDEEDFSGDETDPEEEHEELPIINHKRKQISLCQHKLQGRAYDQFRRRRPTSECQRRLPEIQGVNEDQEWAQLEQMEKLIERQKQELLKNGAPELDYDNEAWGNPKGQKTTGSKKKMIVGKTGTWPTLPPFWSHSQGPKQMQNNQAHQIMPFSHQRARRRECKRDKRRRQNLIKI
jgi:hypothetical protein